MWVLPECVWTAPLMGSQRYGWLCDYVAYRDPRPGDESFDRDMRRVAGRILRSMDPARDTPEDVRRLADAVGCGTQYSLRLACDVALAIPAGANKEYWGVLRALLNHAGHDFAMGVWPETRDAVIGRMMAVVNAPSAEPSQSGAPKMDGAFACAVDLVEALHVDRARHHQAFYRWDRDENLRGIPPLTEDARERISGIQKHCVAFTGARLATRDLGCVYADARKAQLESEADMTSSLSLHSSAHSPTASPEPP